MTEARVGQRVHVDGERGTVVNLDGEGHVTVAWDEGGTTTVPVAALEMVGRLS